VGKGALVVELAEEGFDVEENEVAVVSLSLQWIAQLVPGSSIRIWFFHHNQGNRWSKRLTVYR
jgi:hypothetical protein